MAYDIYVYSCKERALCMCAYGKLSGGKSYPVTKTTAKLNASITKNFLTCTTPSLCETQNRYHIISQEIVLLYPPTLISQLDCEENANITKVSPHSSLSQYTGRFNSSELLRVWKKWASHSKLRTVWSKRQTWSFSTHILTMLVYAPVINRMIMAVCKSSLNRQMKIFTLSLRPKIRRSYLIQ